MILFLRSHGMLRQRDRSHEKQRRSKPETSERHGGLLPFKKWARDRATDRACLSRFREVWTPGTPKSRDDILGKGQSYAVSINLRETQI
jgi:hypothetical protein